jgi:hypothetical protein
VLEHAAAFQHLGDAQLDARGRGQRVDVLAHELQLAAGDQPRSALQQAADAFSVVLLPAPLAPSSATMPPCGTSSETPLMASATRS